MNLAHKNISDTLKEKIPGITDVVVHIELPNISNIMKNGTFASLIQPCRNILARIF